jgi:hypothetical protein
MGFGQIGHQLGGIQRAAAADRGDKPDFLFATERDGALDHVRRRIGLDVLEHRQPAAGIDQTFFGVGGQAGVSHAFIGDQQHPRDVISRDQFRQFA